MNKTKEKEFDPEWYAMDNYEGDGIPKEANKTILTKEFIEEKAQGGPDAVPEEVFKTKESWEEEEIKIQQILEPYFVVLDGRDNEPANETIIEISKEIISILKQRESKYLKVLREIVGEKMEQTKEEEDAEWFQGYGYNQKRQEIIDIIKDNNIEL